MLRERERGFPVQCEDKIKYWSQHAAERAAYDTERKAGRGKLHAYRCRGTSHFHVGHSVYKALAGMKR